MTDPAGPAPPGPKDVSSHPDDASPRNTIFAIVLIAVLLGAMIWVAKLVVDQQNLEKCIASGRRDCLTIEAPPRDTGPANIPEPQR